MVEAVVRVTVDLPVPLLNCAEHNSTLPGRVLGVLVELLDPQEIPSVLQVLMAVKVSPPQHLLKLQLVQKPHLVTTV